MVKSRFLGHLFWGKDSQVAGVIRGPGRALANSYVHGGDGMLPGIALRVRIGMELPEESHGKSRFLQSFPLCRSL